MSGYHGYSKSNRAIAAEAEGKMTASALAKVLKCPTAAIRDHLQPCEWHHTSARYNRTDYYDEDLLIALATNDTAALEDHEEEDIAAGRETLARLRATKPPG